MEREGVKSRGRRVRAMGKGRGSRSDTPQVLRNGESARIMSEPSDRAPRLTNSVMWRRGKTRVPVLVQGRGEKSPSGVVDKGEKACGKEEHGSSGA